MRAQNTACSAAQQSRYVTVATRLRDLQNIAAINERHGSIGFSLQQPTNGLQTSPFHSHVQQSFPFIIHAAWFNLPVRNRLHRLDSGAPRHLRQDVARPKHGLAIQLTRGHHRGQILPGNSRAQAICPGRHKRHRYLALACLHGNAQRRTAGALATGVRLCTQQHADGVHRRKTGNCNLQWCLRGCLTWLDISASLQQEFHDGHLFRNQRFG
mmetsp:Transcript_80217/g.214318  ORF Transcript_80217/g.214318 Transcript_80217/m.214318 type:complete len:212 (-) Transcript_80217:1272-1907(-)